jgi:ubiquitin-conjugating enzyme E2 Z
MSINPEKSKGNDSGNEQKHVSKQTIMRLLKDIKQVKNKSLEENGIYYEHGGEEQDMLFGKAMIVGPANTPYEYGFYFFELRFPVDYPHSPPVLKFCTHDGETRFNPNLYKNGKVCVSILNTWRGEQWSGCQTISSILLTICSLLNNEPLLNEPGIYKCHPDYEPYYNIIMYKNIEIAIMNSLESQYIKTCFSEFINKIKELTIQNRENILDKIKIYKKKNMRGIISTQIYGMKAIINYEQLEKNFKKIIKKIEKN